MRNYINLLEELSYQEASDIFKKYGVNPNQKPEDLKKAYRSLVKKYHSDLTGGDDSILKDINTAYDVLKNPNVQYKETPPSNPYMICPFDGVRFLSSIQYDSIGNINKHFKDIINKYSKPNIKALFYKKENENKIYLFCLNGKLITPIMFETFGDSYSHEFAKDMAKYLIEIEQENTNQTEEKWFYYKTSINNNRPIAFISACKILYDIFGKGYIDESVKDHSNIYDMLIKTLYVKPMYLDNMKWTISSDNNSIIFHFKNENGIKILQDFFKKPI